MAKRQAASKAASSTCPTSHCLCVGEGEAGKRNGECEGRGNPKGREGRLILGGRGREGKGKVKR